MDFTVQAKHPAEAEYKDQTVSVQQEAVVGSANDPEAIQQAMEAAPSEATIPTPIAATTSIETETVPMRAWIVIVIVVL
jgi:hypothetical protein